MKKRSGDDRKKSALEALKIVSAGVKGMTTVNCMEEERYVPTIVTSYNRATGLGGHPLRRMMAIHGKNQTGKSVLAVALAESARRYGHVPVIYEAEWSAEKRWLNRLVAGEGTLFDMPADLDELFSKIQRNLDNLRKGKEQGLIADEVGCCFVIDTLTKLIPKEQMESLLTEGIKKSYSMQAQWISLWTKIIVPQAYRSNSSFIIVLQERQNIGAAKFAKQRKVTLGEALMYDVSQRVECTYSKQIVQEGKVVATQFFYDMEKNKSDGTTNQSGSFFTGTGEGDTPPGLDLHREAMEEASVRDVLKSQKRSKMDYMVATFGEEEILAIRGGKEDFRKHLIENPDEFEKFVDYLNKDARRLKE